LIIFVYQKFCKRTLYVINGNLDIFPIDKPYLILSPNSGFLLCSDGLLLDKSTSGANEKHLYVTQKIKMQQAINNLIGFAYNEGSSDNITVILFEVGKIKKKHRKLEQFTYPPDVKTKKKSAKPKIVFAIISCIILLLIVALIKFSGKRFSDFFSADSVDMNTTLPVTIPSTNQMKLPLQQSMLSVSDSQLSARDSLDSKKDSLNVDFEKVTISNLFPDSDSDIPLSSSQEITLSWESIFENENLELNHIEGAFYRLLYQLDNSELGSPVEIDKLLRCEYTLSPDQDQNRGKDLLVYNLLEILRI